MESNSRVGGALRALVCLAMWLRQIVLTAVDTMEESALLKQVVSNARLHIRGQRVDLTPPCPSVEGKSWTAAVFEAAETGAGSDVPPGLGEALPGLWQENSEGSAKAQELLPSAEENRCRQQIDVDTFDRRQAIESAGGAGLAEFTRRSRRWLLAAVGCFGLDYFAMYLAWAVVDDVAGRAMTVVEWVSRLVMPAVFMMALMSLVEGGILVARQAGLARSLRAGVLLALASCYVGGAAGLTVVRFAAEVPADGSAGMLEHVAVGLVLLLVVAALPLLCSGLLHKARGLRQQVRNMRIDVERRDQQRAVRVAELTRAKDREREIHARTAAPAILRTKFEQAVHVAREELEREEAEVQRIVGQAQAVYRLLKKLEPGEVDEVRMKLVGIVPSGVDSETKRPGLVARFLTVTVLGLALTNSACGASASQPLPPQQAMSVEALCDISSLESGCTEDSLAALFAGWSAQVDFGASATFSVFEVGAAYGDLRLITRVAAPRPARGNIRRLRATWLASTSKMLGTGLASATAKRDEAQLAEHANGRAKERNRSNLLGALLGLARRPSPSGPTTLIVLSDGLAVGEGVNLERRIPKSGDALRGLRKRGTPLELRRYKQAALCGSTHAGLSAREGARLDAFWSEVLSASGLRPQILPTCTDVFTGFVLSDAIAMGKVAL